MRHRLGLEEPVDTADGGGGATRVWSLVAEVWGAVEPLSGSERIEANGIQGRVSHEIWVRHRAGLGPHMRFKMGTRIFEIRAVIDSGERRRVMRCLVEERVP
ncbi:phage head closure protein [Hyphomicrobium nitrativorans]|nr:phage head closure protein [Hyphomicrobium nitrativorans]